MQIFQKLLPTFLASLQPKNKCLYSNKISQTEELLRRPLYYAINKNQLFDVICLIENPAKYDMVLNYFLKNARKTLRNKNGKDLFLKLLLKSKSSHISKIISAIVPNLEAYLEDPFGSICVENLIQKCSHQEQLDFLGHSLAKSFNVQKEGCSDFGFG